MSFTTPVAFLIFNRPDTTEKVFEAIRQAKPPKLLVVADGPRENKPGEAEKCAAVRAIINRVDWNCEVLTNYSEKNLGCKKRVSSGLNWVFSEVEEAIILEDDCLPTPSFFNFCQTLLEYYRYDQKVMHINGSNFINIDTTSNSYTFSKYCHIWGWASWRRAWQYYDVDMKTWVQSKNKKLITSFCRNLYERIYWECIFENSFQGFNNTWDYQWQYACWKEGGLSITPNTNLISNIGFRPDATHTKESSNLENLPTKDIWEIKHPLILVVNSETDEYLFNHVFGGKQMQEGNTWLNIVRVKLSPLKNKITSYLNKITA